jgi:hypothetical protein
VGPSLRRRRQRRARGPIGGSLRGWVQGRRRRLAASTSDRLAAMVFAAAGLLGTAFAAAALVVGSASAAASGWPWFKSDLHVHSVFSGDGDPDLGIIAQAGKAAGYNVFFVTDHGRGSSFPIAGQTGNHLILDGALDRWTPLLVGNPGGVAEIVEGQSVNGDNRSLRVASSGVGGFASVWSRRGPNLRSGNAVLKVSIRPTSLPSGNGGLFVSASVGGDPTIGPPAGYTTTGGAVSPGKSYVFVWYWKFPPPPALYGSTPVIAFQLGAAGSGSTCTGGFAVNSPIWTNCTITLNNALAAVPAADRPMDMNAFQDLQVGASGNAAEGHFDAYALDATAPMTPAQEFAFRNTLISSFDTATFKMYPSVELGVGAHTQRFNYAATDPSQTVQEGTDAIATTQATGFPAQLNHPGVPGGVTPDQTVIDNNAFGADTMEVMAANMIADWDGILSKGVQLIGTWGTDNHVGSWSGESEANFIQAPTIGFNDLMRSVYEGRLYMGLKDFSGRLILNTDATSPDAFPARYPIFVSPAQAAAPAHLAITGGISLGSQVVWIVNGGAQLAADAPSGSSFDTIRQIPLGADFTYVRAELRNSGGKRIAMTEPIMWIDVAGLPSGMSMRVDGVSTPGGVGYTRTTTRGITTVAWAGGPRTLTLTVENPAGSLVEMAGTTGGLTPARVTVAGASVPRAGTLADYQASPRAWLVDASGAMRIKAEQATASAAVVVAFAGAGDTAPPNPPTGVAALPDAAGVTLGWNPASDNTGVAGYTVYRDGVALAEVATNRYRDATAASGASYRYTIDAYDAARNQSLQSAPAIVGPLPPEQTTPTTGPTTTAPPTGPTAAAAVAGAFRSVTAQRHVEAYDVRAALTIGRVPPALARRAPRRGSARARGEAVIAGARRARASAQLSGVSRRLTVVAYDGSTYVARDGRTFRRAVGALRDLLPTMPPAGLGVVPGSVPGSLTGLRLIGTTRVNGVSSRHYRAALTTAGLRRYVASALTRSGRAASLARAAGATARASVNRVDLYVAVSGGQLERATVAVTAAINAGRLVRGLRGRIPGTVKASTLVNAGGYGGSLTVAKPRSRGVVATLRALARG